MSACSCGGSTGGGHRAGCPFAKFTGQIGSITPEHVENPEQYGHAVPPPPVVACRECAVLAARLEQSQADFARLVSALGGSQNVTVPGPQPVVEAQPVVPLPQSVQRALVQRFPGRTRERAEHELFARELVAAGVGEQEIAAMLENGRPIEI